MASLSKGPVHPVVAGGFVVFVGGLVGWLWTGDWRWALTGLLLLLGAAVLVGANNPR